MRTDYLLAVSRIFGGEGGALSNLPPPMDTDLVCSDACWETRPLPVNRQTQVKTLPSLRGRQNPSNSTNWMTENIFNLRLMRGLN